LKKEKAVMGKKFTVGTLFSLLLMSTLASAQEGHPFNGTWRGTITGGAVTSPVVLIMKYDGESMQGMINPGRNSFPIQMAVHDAPNWSLHVTAQSRQGESIDFTGKMHEIGSRDLYIEGNWSQAGTNYTFKVTRE
jgi:hypothetical protein